jgi:hypothetical protein
MFGRLLCWLFGHKLPKGYAGGRPYLEPYGGSVDGIGREHWRLYARCPRCEQKWHVVNVHGPLK